MQHRAFYISLKKLPFNYNIDFNNEFSPYTYFYYGIIKFPRKLSKNENRYFTLVNRN